MARYKRATPRPFERNPGLYQRTSDTWTTRYYQRKSDKIFDLLGLNTAPDDYHKKAGGSPFLTNVRYMGEREGDQRAQVMSRKGAQFIATSGELELPRDMSDASAYLNLYEGKVIQWELQHNRRLTGIYLHVFNKDQASGFVRITVRNVDTEAELSSGIIDLAKTNIREYQRHQVRFIKTVRESRVLIRIEILDDVADEEDRSETRSKRSIRILSTPHGNHSTAVHTLPNTNDALRELPYEFTPHPTIPLTGTTINDWQPMIRSKEVRIGGQLHIIYPVRHDSIVEIFRANLETGIVSSVTTNVSPSAKQVRFEQAEGYMYYVDGESDLKRINLTTLETEVVIAKPDEIQVGGVTPESLKAKKGASLIHFLQNRLYLSGFRDDPNLVIYSLIDDVKPRFEQYNDRFYSPDQSPELSAGSPVTALSSTAGILVVFRLDGLSLYTPGAGLEISATQATPEGAQLGVLNQEAVASGKNNIYFFNPIEGVCRFAGSLNRVVSQDIENMLKRIKNKEAVFMIYQNKRVRMYFSFTEDRPDSCFYYYSDLEGSLPWYLDINTPVSSAVASKKSEEIYAIHSEVPSIMSVDASFTDFDSYIEMEYDTAYRTPAEIDGWLYVRRVHVHELSNSNHSIFIAVDPDHTDSPVVYRRYVEKGGPSEANPDAVFKHTAEDGITVISIPLYLKCRSYQVRVKRYVYKDSAETLGISVEYGTKEPI